MKRINNLFEKICSVQNLKRADIAARKGKITAKDKAVKKEIALHDLNREANIIALHESLINKTYTTSAYRTFTIHEPKEREISCLPYTDRIVHHAMMFFLEPIFVAAFTVDSYSCIKGRGPLSASMALREALKDKAATPYYLQIDIKKFYPNVDHGILKALLRRKFKDNDLLWLLDDIIDSAEGLPIGNYTSAYLANFYLCYLDHYVKEVLQVKNFFRYADDYIFLSHSKSDLHDLRKTLAAYLHGKLKLEIKSTWHVTPVSCGINFVGYIHYSATHVLIRPAIKKRFARMLKRNPNEQSIASYLGWLKHCNSVNLKRKLLPLAA